MNIALRTKKRHLSQVNHDFDQSTDVTFFVCVSAFLYFDSNTFPTNNEYSTEPSRTMESVEWQFYARFLCSDIFSLSMWAFLNISHVDDWVSFIACSIRKLLNYRWTKSHSVRAVSSGATLSLNRSGNFEIFCEISNFLFIFLSIITHSFSMFFSLIDVRLKLWMPATGCWWSN